MKGKRLTVFMSVLLAGLLVFTACAPKESGEWGDKTYDVDVVVVGGGGAGFAAAYEARKAGLDVLVLEQLPVTGGNTALAGSAMNTSNLSTQRVASFSTTASEKATVEGIIANKTISGHPNALVRSWHSTLSSDYAAWKAAGEIGLFDSPALHKIQTFWISGEGDSNKPEIVDYYCDNTEASLNFLLENGASFTSLGIIQGALWRRSHNIILPPGFMGIETPKSGDGFVRPAENAYRNLDGKTFLEHEVTRILKDETTGRITGVEGRWRYGNFTVNAKKAVIITTGGFGGNRDMLQANNPREDVNIYGVSGFKWPDLRNPAISSSNHIGATGSGIRMAQAVGASLIGMKHIQIHPYGGYGFPTDPAILAYPVTSGGLILEHTMIVNKAGLRIANETGRRDQNSLAQFEAMRPENGGGFWNVTGPVKPDSPVAGKSTAELAEFIVGGGAENAAARATFIRNFEQEVVKYNKYADPSDPAIDPFGKEVFSPIKMEGPWYVVKPPAGPFIHHTMGGIEINDKCQVLDVNGKVIPGLFAAGEAAGGLHGTNRMGGNAVAEVVTMGRRAGQQAALQ